MSPTGLVWTTFPQRPTSGGRGCFLFKSPGLLISDLCFYTLEIRGTVLIRPVPSHDLAVFSTPTEQCQRAIVQAEYLGERAPPFRTKDAPTLPPCVPPSLSASLSLRPSVLPPRGSSDHGVRFRHAFLVSRVLKVIVVSLALPSSWVRQCSGYHLTAITVTDVAPSLKLRGQRSDLSCHEYFKGLSGAQLCVLLFNTLDFSHYEIGFSGTAKHN